MFRTILVAIDGSEHSKNALEIACDISSKYNADIHLIHVPEVEATAIAVGPSAVIVQPSDEIIENAGRHIMDKATEQAVHFGCKPSGVKISQGDPAQIILNQASDLNADLLVTGRRGMGKLSGLLMGSVSQKVSQLAPCPCLTVK